MEGFSQASTVIKNLVNGSVSLYKLLGNLQMLKSSCIGTI